MGMISIATGLGSRLGRTPISSHESNPFALLRQAGNSWKPFTAHCNPFIIHACPRRPDKNPLINTGASTNG